MNQTLVSDPVRPSPKPGFSGFPSPLPTGSYLTLQTLLGLLSSSPWRTSVSVPRSHQRQDPWSLVPSVPSGLGKSKDGLSPAGDPRARTRALGWESWRLVPPARR